MKFLPLSLLLHLFVLTASAQFKVGLRVEEHFIFTKTTVLTPYNFRAVPATGQGRARGYWFELKHPDRWWGLSFGGYGGRRNLVFRRLYPDYQAETFYADVERRQYFYSLATLFHARIFHRAGFAVLGTLGPGLEVIQRYRQTATLHPSGQRSAQWNTPFLPLISAAQYTGIARLGAEYQWRKWKLGVDAQLESPIKPWLMQPRFDEIITWSYGVNLKAGYQLSPLSRLIEPDYRRVRP